MYTGQEIIINDEGLETVSLGSSSMASRKEPLLPALDISPTNITPSSADRMHVVIFGQREKSDNSSFSPELAVAKQHRQQVSGMRKTALIISLVSLLVAGSISALLGYEISADNRDITSVTGLSKEQAGYITGAGISAAGLFAIGAMLVLLWASCCKPKESTPFKILSPTRELENPAIAKPSA